LISDSKRTPFNIGRRVELNDFTLEEALPLAEGLNGEPEQALAWILAWTGGHPYLTQRICAHLAKSNEVLTEENVALAVEQLFSGQLGQQDNNLQFVRDMLLKRASDVRRVLKTYREIRTGRPVTDDERSLPKSHLKISGVVHRENGRLAPRNLIYAHAFDPAWIKENMPPLLARWQVVALSLAILVTHLTQKWHKLDTWRMTNYLIYTAITSSVLLDKRQPPAYRHC
jgi:AAA-like domain